MKRRLALGLVMIGLPLSKNARRSNAAWTRRSSRRGAQAVRKFLPNAKCQVQGAKCRRAIFMLRHTQTGVHSRRNLNGPKLSCSPMQRTFADGHPPLALHHCRRKRSASWARRRERAAFRSRQVCCCSPVAFSRSRGYGGVSSGRDGQPELWGVGANREQSNFMQRR